MRDARGHEQDVTRSETAPRLAANELSRALRHDIDFVARMRRLIVFAARGVKLDHQRAVLKQSDGTFTLRTRQTIERVCQFYLFRIVVIHDGAVIIHYNEPHRLVIAMNKADLDKLAGNPNFISEIYNYCDRWCERCQFTSRCFLYATEEVDPDLADPEVRDITNEKFWTKLQTIFADTTRLMADLAAEEGVDFGGTEDIARLPENDREWDEAEYDDLSLACKSYALKAFGWLKREYDAEQIVANTHDSTLNEDEVTIDNALEVIRWYQFFIATKTTRALSGTKNLDTTEDEADILSAVPFSNDEHEDD